MWNFDDYGYRQRRQPARWDETVTIPVRPQNENGRVRPPQSPPLPVEKREETKTNEAIDWQEKYARLAAELDNNKKRLARNYANQVKRDKEALLRDFLPIADNLERALAHASGSQAEAAMRQGIKLTYKAFMEILAGHGVKPIEAQGQSFDPNWHEAIATVPQSNLPAGTILRVEETGYKIGGKLLRPAKAVVAA